MKGMIFLKTEETAGTKDSAYLFLPGEILSEGDTIKEINRLKETDLTQEEKERYILPGLVDIHTHGCMGADFCDSVKAEGDAVLETICAYETSVGVTSLCPTTMTYDEARLTAIMQKARDFTHGNHPLKQAVAGVHLEGPFISREKCGAQNPEYIQKPDLAMLERLQEASGGLVRLVAIAPETDGAIDCIRKGSAFRFSIAHTTADYETASRAIAAGAKHVTHMYNAMPPFLNRAPSVVGAAFDDKDTFVELIGDGIHVHPSVVRATFSMFGAKRVVLISDSMEATGKPDGTYALGGQEVFKKGNLATLADGTLAGSVTNLFDCMKSVIAMGVPQEAAIRAATINPARSVGIDGLVGSLDTGKRADILVCDKALNLQRVIASGVERKG
ncbi:MAG: N-acetylglucosamine-6-phosphate deacetylase [Lachnospiraceae bacterium]|nr:N-acetylglucosamine-6-phosphate deacetylase [Lachnospiraceae bacterium]